MQTATQVSPQTKQPYTVQGKRIWATSQQDAQWQYEQMQKQLKGRR